MNLAALEDLELPGIFPDPGSPSGSPREQLRRLGDIWSAAPAVLVFVRHFG